MRSRTIPLLILAFTACACRSQQLHKDQDQFRHALLQMQTDQLLDNLVRAYNGLPIVHMDYTQITGTITQTAEGQVSGSVSEAAEVITKSISSMLTGRQESQLTVTGNPVLDSNVYLA